MIQSKCIKYNIFEKFSRIHKQKGIDLYTTAQIRHLQIYKKLKTKENGIGAFALTEVLKFCRIPDNRIGIVAHNAKIVKKGNPHNALEDCKLEAECFFRLTQGKNFFKEFDKLKIPEYLKNDPAQ